MKFIDKNGRIFAKINIIDGTIIILLLTVAVTWAALIKKTVSMEDAYRREIAIVKARVNNLPVQVFELIKKGDKEIDADYGFYSVIEKAEKIRNQKVSLSDGTTGEETDIVIWIKAKVYADEDIMLYRYGKLKPGKAFSFHSEKYILPSCYILEVIRNNATNTSGELPNGG